MLTCIYAPQPPLSAWIDAIWLYDQYAPSYALERILPDGTMELVISLREDTLRVADAHQHAAFQHFRGPLLCGIYSESFVIDTAQQASLMGVHFKPGGAFPFLNIPASEFHNTHVTLDTVWGSLANDLHDQLREAVSPEAKCHILEHRLCAQMRSDLVAHPAVGYALQAFCALPHTHTIADVSARIGLSQRHFIQVFRNAVGLSPKLFCRIRRFQAVLHTIEREDDINWADVALACGYYDQAHCINDFRAFAGITPTDYLARRGEQRNHVPL